MKLTDEIKERMKELRTETPEQMAAFQKFLETIHKEGALSAKQKELIALAIGIAKQCKICIAFHLEKALNAGATREEILEAGWVAVLMAGGPGLAYFTILLEMLEETGK